ncbi:hypothetical protein ABZ924_02635 [Streptomyces sp. NPDC046876]|uniref:DUF6928 family protein n=1 Tax=Streptomyces sp. NPDC046876 TaxID=3155616 RepID=UPI00341076AE
MGAKTAERLTYAGSFPSVDLVCDRRLMFVRPSEVSVHVLEAAAGRRVILHAMHSVSDWLAFAVWEDGRLRRSLSLSPDGGIVEDIGDPFPFETPFWAGDRPVDPDPEWEEEPYALPFHPLELGNEALRAFFGFLLEGHPSVEDVDPDGIPLLGFRRATASESAAYGRGPVDEVASVLERVLRPPFGDEAAWRQLWHLLATERLTTSLATATRLLQSGRWTWSARSWPESTGTTAPTSSSGTWRP